MKKLLWIAYYESHHGIQAHWKFHAATKAEAQAKVAEALAGFDILWVGEAATS